MSEKSLEVQQSFFRILKSFVALIQYPYIYESEFEILIKLIGDL